MMQILLLLVFLWHIPAIFHTIIELWKYLRNNPNPDANEFLDAYDQKYIGDYEGFFMITYLSMGLVACAMISLFRALSGIFFIILVVGMIWIVSLTITGTL